MRHSAGTLAIALLVGAPVLLAAQPPDPPPFEVTEDRPRCANYQPHRQPLFGTTHLHTGLSFDASTRFVDYDAGNNPRGAYRFAKGEGPIQLPDPTGKQDPNNPLRNPSIDRPLDWGAVTDHSEHFGEMGFCKNLLDGRVPERFSMDCRMINGFFYRPGRAINPVFGSNIASQALSNLSLVNDGAISRNTRLPICVRRPERCSQAELQVWEEVRNAAEEAYDRTSDCRFTSFVAYEMTSTPLLNNWHRNVIFRNDRVVRSPVTAIDMAVRVNERPRVVPVNTLGPRFRTSRGSGRRRPGSS